MYKFNTKGSVSVYFAIILPAIILLILISIDFFDMIFAQSNTDDILNIAFMSALSNYENKLHSDYCILGISENKKEKIKEKIFNDVEDMLYKSSNLNKIRLVNLDISFSECYKIDDILIKQIKYSLVKNKVINGSNVNELSYQKILDIYIMGSFKHKLSRDFNEKYINNKCKCDIFSRISVHSNEIEFLLDQKVVNYDINDKNIYKNYLENRLKELEDTEKIKRLRNLIELNINSSIQEKNFKFDNCFAKINIEAKLINPLLIFPDNYFEYKFSKSYF